MTIHLYKRQSGMTTLLVAIMLLLSITIVAMTASKTVFMDTKITADNYRTSQASAAANAAMDEAVAYYKQAGFDHDSNGAVDFSVGAEPSANSCALPASTENQMTLTSGGQTNYAQYYFDTTVGNICDSTNAADMTRGLVMAKGWSDDCKAVRTISQCVTTITLFNKGEGPAQPFISKASVGAFGNGTYINRYNNSSIWSGGSMGVAGAAFATYLRPTGTSVGDYTEAQLNDNSAAINTVKVSDKNTGAGIDVITNDATLANKTATQFFQMFFSLTKTEVKSIAVSSDQYFSSNTDLTNMTGLIWVDGNETITGGTIGSSTDPAILIVNGDLAIHGTTNIYGAVYVTGQISISGTPTLYGSIIGESNTPSTGGGNLTVVYVPMTGGSAGTTTLTKGTGAIVAGSWKDW